MVKHGKNQAENYQVKLSKEKSAKNRKEKDEKNKFKMPNIKDLKKQASEKKK